MKQGLNKYGHKNVTYIKDPITLAKSILPNINSGDLIICLGAGTITKIANNLEQDLKNEYK